MPDFGNEEANISKNVVVVLKILKIEKVGILLIVNLFSKMHLTKRIQDYTINQVNTSGVIPRPKFSFSKTM